MTRFELIKAISKNNETLSSELIEQVVDTFFTTIEKSLLQGKRVELRRFGILFVKQRPARKARNPRNGQTVPLPPRTYLHFKMSTHLLKAINSL